MQLNWAPEHCDALRDLLAGGMPYSEIANTINARFSTAYSRNAAISRARRMGLAGADRPRKVLKPWSPLPPKAGGLNERNQRSTLASASATGVFEPATPVELRCVELVPRHLTLIDLKSGDCRYPYGGDEDGEAITFCAQPRRGGSSYCAPHFQLTRRACTASERASGAIFLKLVEVA